SRPRPAAINIHTLSLHDALPIYAVRVMTAGAVDFGEKPSVISSIAKYHVTERARVIVNDGMDIIGGKGICLGPSNFLGRAYQQIDRKSTRLNSSHVKISYAVFCL